MGRAFKVGGRVLKLIQVLQYLNLTLLNIIFFSLLTFTEALQAEQKQIVGLMIMQMLMLFMAGQEVIRGSNAKVLKGGLFRTEATNGAYLYNFSSNNWGFRSIKTTVSL